jgi:hypothetical protein
MSLAIKAASLPSPPVANNNQPRATGRTRRVFLPSRNANDWGPEFLAGFR